MELLLLRELDAGWWEALAEGGVMEGSFGVSPVMFNGLFDPFFLSLLSLMFDVVVKGDGG